MPRQMWDAGCSAFSWTTENGLHLWGRNFDFNRIAEDTNITFLPRDTAFYTRGSALENNLNAEQCLTSRYACVGTGSLVLGSTPTLYEGVNERGLMGGQLYYRKFAGYPREACPDTLPLQPAFAVTYFLARCASVQEVVDALESDITIVGESLLGAVPSVHWIFTDTTGESVIIEPDGDAPHIYRNSMGVLTNSPSYPWHRENLLNYGGIRQRDHADLKLNGETIGQCFSGTGCAGLPGDFASTSRFVRLSYLKAFGEKGRDEQSGVARMFRLFENVAFPCGLVEIGNEEHTTAYDAGVSAYDYTLYTAVICAETGKFYWTTYENPQIQCVDLRALCAKGERRQFPLFMEDGVRYHE